MSHRRHSNRGQASVEYLLGCLVVLALLWVDAASGQSTLSLVIESVRKGFTQFAAALSIA